MSSTVSSSLKQKRRHEFMQMIVEAAKPKSLELFHAVSHCLINLANWGPGRQWSITKCHNYSQHNSGVMHKKERDRHWPFVLNLEQYWSVTSFACLTLEVYNILLDIERNLQHFHSVGISLRTFPISSELFVYSSFEKVRIRRKHGARLKRENIYIRSW